MIHFQCNNCSQKMKVEDIHVGKKVKCLNCPTILTIPSPSPLPEPNVDVQKNTQDIFDNCFQEEKGSPDKQQNSANNILPKEETKPCPFCGETILKAAKKCKHCGEFLDEKDHNATENRIHSHPISPSNREYSEGWPKGGFVGLIIGTILLPILGLIMGIIGLCSKGKARQGSVLLSLFFVGMVLYAAGFFFALTRAKELAHRIQCAAQLSGIGKAMQVYAFDSNNEYPDPTQWCDLLTKYADVTEEVYICPSAFEEGKKISYYVINPYAKYDAVRDGWRTREA